MAKESAMVQIETKITCVCDSIRLMAFNGHCWFPVAPFVRRCNPCNLPVLPCPGKAKLGMDHPQTLSSLNNLALVLEAQGHLAEAEPLLREALKRSPGAQLQGFQRDFGQWIWSHTLLDFRWVIRFLMTGTGAAILAAILLGCFWMPHPVRNFVRGYSELKESFFSEEFWNKMLWVWTHLVAHVSMCCVRCLRHILPLLRCQRPSEFQGLPGPSRYVFGQTFPKSRSCGFQSKSWQMP